MGPETRVLKITNVPVVYMALGLDDFDAGKFHNSGHWKGWALKISTFWAQMSFALLVVISGTKKYRAVWVRGGGGLSGTK